MDTLNVQWNSADKGALAVISNGGLTAMIPNNTNNVKATMGRSKGKWYWELTIDSTRNIMVGVCNSLSPITAILYNTPNAKLYYNATGNKYQGAIAYGRSFISGDTISVALDMDAGKIEFYKNGVNQGVAFSDLAQFGEVFPVIAGGATGTEDNRITANFGATPFKYSVPQGYLAYNIDIQEKILLEKDNKGFSVNIEDKWHETKMTSNTAPSPLVASASSTQSTTYAPWKAFDGIILPLDNQSSWSATSTLRSGWLQLDFGTNTIINKLSLTVLEYTTSPKDFQILGSNDNANWTTLLDVKGANWSQTIVNETKEFFLNELANNRYYRINITTVSATNKQPMITELKYGYEKKELVELPSIDKNMFVKYGKESFEGLDSNLKTKTYVLDSSVGNTVKEKQLSKKPLSIRIT